MATGSFFFTQSGSRKAKNIADDPRVALSIVDRDDPYRQADVRGRVVERLDGEEALAAMDRLSQKYIGAPFPMRSPETVAFVVEVDKARHVKLPFEHDWDEEDDGQPSPPAPARAAPMRRHPALTPLSRDHHRALVEAGAARRAADADGPGRLEAGPALRRVLRRPRGAPLPRRGGGPLPPARPAG